MSEQTTPVLIEGHVTVDSMPKEVKFLRTTMRTYTLVPGSQDGPLLIRERSGNIAYTRIIPSLGPSDQAGNDASIAVPNPGTGVNLSFTLPYAAQIVAITGQYQNASVGNEFPNVQIQDAAGNQIAQIPLGQVNAATTIQFYISLGGFAQQGGGTNNPFMPLPNLGVLPAGFKIFMAAIGGTDVISNVRILLSGDTAHGWVAAEKAEALKLTGAYLNNNSGPIESAGNTELWAYADPASQNSLTLTVIIDSETL